MDKMKHVKNRAETELETERRKLISHKSGPKRLKQSPVDRKIAFDDEELEKYSPQEPVSKTNKNESIKKLIIAAVVCIVCGLLVFAYANRDKLTFESISNWFNYELLGKSPGEGFPVYINGTNIEPGNVGLLDGKYFTYVSDTSSVSVGTDGGELYRRQIPYTNPVMNIDGSFNLVYNLDGKNYQVSTASDVLVDGNTEGSIFYGAINKNGTYGLITKADGYLSKLSVYDKSGNLKYSYSFSEYYAYCADINEDGTQAIVGTICTKNGEAVSALYLLNFSEEEPKAIVMIDNSTVYSIKYLPNGNAAIICDDSLIIYDAEKGSKVVNNYNDRMLADYYINVDTGCIALILSRSGDGRMCDIEYYNSTGEREVIISTDLKVSSVDLYKDKIAVLSQGEVYEFNKQGEQIYSADAGNDAKIIKLFSENTVYVVGISEIRVLDFKNPPEQEMSGVLSNGAS